MSRRTSTHRRQRGFTLMEVMVAATVLGIAWMSGTWAMSATTSTKSAYENQELTPALIAKEIHTLATALPKAPSGTLAVTNGADVVALDSLIGAVFTPPIKADCTADTSLAGWSQKVSLKVYDLSDLTTPTLDSPALGLSADDSKIYRLTVTVLEGADVADTFSWWLSP